MVAAGPRVVAVLGRGIVDADEPVLAADDLGLTRGDGCFDATRLVVTDRGEVHIDHLDGHLARFARSAVALDLPPPDEHEWRALIDTAAAAWRDEAAPGEAVLRVMLTGGRETGRAKPVTGVVTIAALDPSAIAARAGITVITLCRGHASDAFADVPWLLGGVKTLSYAINVAAGREAARRGAQDALFTSTDGFALEGPRSALVWRHDGDLFTTRHDGTGILASVTQAAAFAAARTDGVRAEPSLVPVDALFDVDGAWLVSAGRGVVPIRRLDGRALATDDAWTERLRAWAG
ncbi:MAG: aminodeoxychorismate lyase [Desertimonas sp.]